jgi:hypothetical protein
MLLNKKMYRSLKLMGKYIENQNKLPVKNNTLRGKLWKEYYKEIQDDNVVRLLKQANYIHHDATKNKFYINGLGVMAIESYKLNMKSKVREWAIILISLSSVALMIYFNYN